MFKQKIKFSLIDDYINLLKIDKVLLNCYNYKCLTYYDFNEQIKNSYESLFLKYGLLDVSFLVLKQEIVNSPYNVYLTLDEVENMQNKIVNNMFEKLKKLKLNDVEINFLIKKLYVKNC